MAEEDWKDITEQVLKQIEEDAARPGANQTIKLDCAPGALRPGHLIAGVIKDTGLQLIETSSRIFGNWTWDYSDVGEVTWKQAQKIIKSRIEELYKQGYIRYGSW